MDDFFDDMGMEEPVAIATTSKNYVVSRKPKTQVEKSWYVTATARVEGEFRVTLPYPPPQNQCLRAAAVPTGKHSNGKVKYHAHVYHTEKATQYLADAKKIVRAEAERRERAGEWILYEGIVQVTLIYYHPNDRDDFDGVIKKPIDALQGYVFPNDRQIRRSVTEHYLDRDNPRVEVIVEAM